MKTEEAELLLNLLTEFNGKLLVYTFPEFQYIDTDWIEVKGIVEEYGVLNIETNCASCNFYINGDETANYAFNVELKHFRLHESEVVRIFFDERCFRI